MNDVTLDVIEARASAATPGPWRPQAFVGDPGDPKETGILAGVDYIISADGFVPKPADATFIAAAREYVPALVAEVRALRAALAARTEEAARLCEWRLHDAEGPLRDALAEAAGAIRALGAPAPPRPEPARAACGRLYDDGDDNFRRCDRTAGHVGDHFGEEDDGSLTAQAAPADEAPDPNCDWEACAACRAVRAGATTGTYEIARTRSMHMNAAHIVLSWTGNPSDADLEYAAGVLGEPEDGSREDDDDEPGEGAPAPSDGTEAKGGGSDVA